MYESHANFLTKIPPFSFLPEDEIRVLAYQITEITYPKGAQIAIQNKTKLDFVMVVESGQLEMYYEKDGQKFLRISLDRGAIFGGLSILMNQGVSLRTVTIDQSATFYKIPKRGFLDLCNRFKRFNDFFADAFEEQIKDVAYAALVASSPSYLFFTGVIPFSFLPEKALLRVAAEVTTVRYPKDTIVYIQGQSRVEHLYIVQKGAAERYYEENDTKTLRGLLAERDIYGGISMLVNEDVPVRTLRTLEDTGFYILSKNTFLKLCRENEAFSEFFTDSFGKRMLDRSYASIITRSTQPRDESLQFFSRPVSSLYTRDPVSCPADMSIQDAAMEMSRRNCSSIFAQSETGEYVGVVTDNDFRNKVIATGHDIRRPVREIMSGTLLTISSQAMIFEALMEMMRNNVKHLAISDSGGRVIGVVTNSDLLSAQGQAPFFLLREINAAGRVDDLFDKHGRLPTILRNLINSGAKAKNVTSLITMMSDATLNRILRFALDDLGPPPCRFTFMILGSEGRKEQTLKTDQDNAIVYEDVPDTDKSAAEAYFLKLGERVCTWLDQAGYDFCLGGVMAKNPQWCQPLSSWKTYFSNWIRKAEGEALLQASIFFDFRLGYGDASFIESLRRHLFDALTGWAGFFRNLADNALYFKPPIGFFRNFVVESKGEHRNAFDIKSAMQPIVDFARIYALHLGIEETNTQERLKQLYLKKALSHQDYEDIDQGYAFLMQLRFERQLAATLEEHAKPDNYINPKLLSRIEQTTLKEIFKRIENLQNKMSFDFTGQA